MSYQFPQDDIPSGYPRRDGRTSSGSYRSHQTYAIPRPSRIRSSEHRFHPGAWVVTLLVVLVVAAIGYYIVSYVYGTERHETFTVTRLDDQASGSSHRYLVFTRNDVGQVNVYEDTDSLGHFKFNSSDLFAQLQVGHRYDCDLYGRRNHFLSQYPDLLSCTAAGR